MTAEQRTGTRGRTGMLLVLTVVIAGAALHVTSPVTLPIAYALLLTALLAPLRTWLRRRLPRKLEWLGVGLTLLAALSIVLLFAGAVGFCVRVVASDAGRYAERAGDALEQLRAWASDLGMDLGGNPLDSAENRQRLLDLLRTGVSSVGSVLAFIVLVFFLSFLMLVEVGKWREKVDQAIRGDGSRRVVESMTEMAVQIRRYMSVQTLVSLLSGTTVGLFLFVMGVDFAFVWGFLSFLLNYIPTIGSVASVAAPTLMALIQGGVGWALAVLGGLVVIEQVIGNYIGPKMQGRALSLSPLVVLVSLLFWGFIWGIPGALAAVPLTSCLVIVAANVNSLRPVAILLSDHPEDVPSDREVQKS